MSDQGEHNYRRRENAVSFSNRLLAALCIHHPDECPEAVAEVQKRIKARGALESLKADQAQQEKAAVWAMVRKHQPPRPVIPEMPLIEIDRRVSVIDIQQKVCECYGISRVDLLSPRRTANIVGPRQVAMYLAKVLTTRSLPELGRRFGGKDHTTVLHAVRKIESRVGRDSAFAEQVESVRLAIVEG